MVFGWEERLDHAGGVLCRLGPCASSVWAMGGTSQEVERGKERHGDEGWGRTVELERKPLGGTWQNCKAATLQMLAIASRMYSGIQGKVGVEG